jgi:hypothetical protein
MGKLAAAASLSPPPAGTFPTSAQPMYKRALREFFNF